MASTALYIGAMKYISLFILLLAAASAFAQSEDKTVYPPPRNPVGGHALPAPGVEADKPFKRANLIILHTADPPFEAYIKLGRLLLADGYPIDKSDKEMGYISTGYRATLNRAVEAALRFAIIAEPNGSRIEARGVCRMPSMGNTVLRGDSPIDFRGAFGSPAGIAWQEMQRFTATYQASAVGYTLRP